MINPEDIKAGMTLGHADAELIRDTIVKLTQRAEVAEAESQKLHAKWQQAEWVISGEQQNIRVLQGRESALNAEVLTLRAMIPHDQPCRSGARNRTLLSRTLALYSKDARRLPSRHPQ